MQPRGFFTFPVFIAIVALFALGSGVYVVYKNVNNVTTEMGVPSVISYTDPQYGFSFQYPSKLIVETSGYESMHPFASDPVAYVQLQNDETQTKGYMTVNLSPDTSYCAGSSDIQTTSINRVSFATDFAELSSGTQVQRTYSTLHNSTCYAIDLLAFPSACVNSGCENRRWSKQTLITLLNELDVIARTFKFSDSQ